MNMDKIPIEMFNESGEPGGETFSCGSLTITKAEFANAEKINDLIEWCREIQSQLIKIEGK